MTTPPESQTPDAFRDDQPRVSRRIMLQASACVAVGAALPTASRGATLEAHSVCSRIVSPDSLQPVEAIPSLTAALTRHALVALTERHMLQEWHDLATALLTNPALSSLLNDIVVEFGNAAYQPLCDRYILEGQLIPKHDLEQVWRQIGDPTWNSPVYEQFFRTVRAVNRDRPAARRIRVLLGQPPITMSQVIAHPNDRSLAARFAQPLDKHLAQLVEREVLARGRRALLVAGKGHLLRGLSTDNNHHEPNAATQIVQRTRATLYVIDNLILPPGKPQDTAAARAHTELTRQPPAVVATLSDTWLGKSSQQLANGWLNELADRATSHTAARYDQQADAILYLGAGETLTASQPDPTIYMTGSYPQQLRRTSTIAHAGDQLANGIRWATAKPNWFALL
jgi:hypothetical protein